MPSYEYNSKKHLAAHARAAKRREAERKARAELRAQRPPDPELRARLAIASTALLAIQLKLLPEQLDAFAAAAAALEAAERARTHAAARKHINELIATLPRLFGLVVPRG